MTNSADAPPTDPIDVSEYRLRTWRAASRVIFAIAVSLGFASMLAVDLALSTGLLVGTMVISAGLGATLALGIVLVVMTFVASWLFWFGGITNIADLVSGGEYGRTRSETFRAADRRFGMVALWSLAVIPFVPILMVLD